MRVYKMVVSATEIAFVCGVRPRNAAVLNIAVLPPSLTLNANVSRLSKAAILKGVAAYVAPSAVAITYQTLAKI